MQLLLFPTGGLWIDGLLSLTLSSYTLCITTSVTSSVLQPATATTTHIYNYTKNIITIDWNWSSSSRKLHNIISATTTGGFSTTGSSRLIADHNVHPDNQLTFYNTNNNIVNTNVANSTSKEANTVVTPPERATLPADVLFEAVIVAAAEAVPLSDTEYGLDFLPLKSSCRHSSSKRNENDERGFRVDQTKNCLWLFHLLFGEEAGGKFREIVSCRSTRRKRSGSDILLFLSSGSGSESSNKDSRSHQHHNLFPFDTESSRSVLSSSPTSVTATVASVTLAFDTQFENGGLGVSQGRAGEEDFSSVQDAFVEGSHLWTLLVAGYSLVFTVGVIGNSMLLAALCGSGGRARALPVRNHLMVNLAAADLLVTGICVPISACVAASHTCWPGFLVPWMCQLGPLLQRTPVAASTLSLALLSLDRWAAIRHPRFAQRFRERRFVAMSMASIWILASLVAAPLLWVRQWTDDGPPYYWAQAQNGQNTFDTSGHMNDTKNSSSSDWDDMEWGRSGLCRERWTNGGMQMAYTATYIGTAFVSPALIVAACHASVSQKLTAQLQVLTGADRISSHPRPKQVIIVARDLTNNPNANTNGPMNGNPITFPGAPLINSTNFNGHGAINTGGNVPPTIIIDPPKPSSINMKLVPCDPNSDEDDVYLRMQIEADLESFRQLSQLQQNQNNTSQGNRRGMKFYRTGRANSPVRNIPTANGKLGTALRAARRETSIIRAHRRLRKKFNVSSSAANKQPPPLLPTHSSQSFRSRRRAANLLAALAAVFVFCWVPYVLCAICEMFLPAKSWIRLVIPFSLFLGHVHSAINPVVSWRLNRSAFVRFQRQPIFSFLPDWSWLRFCRTCTAPCCCCFCCFSEESCVCSKGGNCCTGCLCCGQRHPHLHRTNTRYPHQQPNQNNLHPLQQQSNRRYSQNTSESRSCQCSSCCPSLFTRRRSSSPDAWNRNSSTNEAGLGAFHPKYLARMPAPEPVSKCHTSHFLR